MVKLITLLFFKQKGLSMIKTYIFIQYVYTHKMCGSGTKPKSSSKGGFFFPFIDFSTPAYRLSKTLAAILLWVRSCQWAWWIEVMGNLRITPSDQTLVLNWVRLSGYQGCAALLWVSRKESDNKNHYKNRKSEESTSANLEVLFHTDYVRLCSEYRSMMSQSSNPLTVSVKLIPVKDVVYFPIRNL
jgi:hypothetical protein